MLASDDNNPAFANPTDPDSMLHVEFYDFEAPDKWGIEVLHKPDAKLPKCPYVRIAVPGNKDSIIETPADGSHVRRFPRQWLHYQMQTGKIANAENVPGWKIEEWSELNEEQVRQLKFMRFFTVEQIAGASDAQIQSMGMGGAGLRTRAQEALRAKQGKAVSEAVAERDAKINGLEAQMAELKAMLSQLVPEKRGPGRPAKEAA